MELKQKILGLRNSIALLETELDTANAKYLLDCQSDGITQEEYGGYTFSVQANPPALDIDKKNVPADLYKPAMDTGAVRKYLLENGTQPWGALNYEKPFKLVVKAIALKE